jgi:riboflavin biosynthesis pyrimidine reductase
MSELDNHLASLGGIVGVRANFVVDSQGNFVDASGSSAGLTTPADKRLLIRLRQLSDLIVTDAATARAEKYIPSKHAPIQIWSRRGNFEGIAIAEGLIARHVVDAVAELKMLRTKFHHITLETGPKLTAIFAAAGQVDALNLTVTGATSELLATDVLRRTLNTLELGYLHKIATFEYDGNFFFSCTR